MRPSTIQIAVLDTDEPVPTVLEKRGLYSDIFTSLLQDASARLSKPTITTYAFNTVANVYPPESLLPSLTGILITGSAASAYYTEPWVKQLDAWISYIYTSHPHIKIFGSCFGHQIVCQSLFRNCGVRVEKDTKGWEVGVHKIMLAPEFMRMFPRITSTTRGVKGEDETKQLPTPEETPAGSPTFSLSEDLFSDAFSLRLQFVHADHVVLPSTSTTSSLPGDSLILGSTPHCACQGVYRPNRILTFQGHFEFDRFVNSETVLVFGKLAGWDDEKLSSALEAIDQDDDSERAAEMVVNFFLEG